MTDIRLNRVGFTWWTITFLSTLIALYGISYFFRGESAFPEQLAVSFKERPWGIYIHAFFSGVGLLVGPFQFHTRLRVSRLSLHQLMGRIYIICCFLGGSSGLYIAFFAHGGWITTGGFGSLAVLLIAATSIALIRIKEKDIIRHRLWMLRSYALMFAAVTLRIELPILIILHSGDFTPAYQWVSWLCWVPNIAVAEWVGRRGV